MSETMPLNTAQHFLVTHSEVESIFYVQEYYRHNIPGSTIVLIPASTIIGESPKPGNGEGFIRKGIRHKIIASAL
jgi:hypothetical protein